MSRTTPGNFQKPGPQWEASTYKYRLRKQWHLALAYYSKQWPAINHKTQGNINFRGQHKVDKLGPSRHKISFKWAQIDKNTINYSSHSVQKQK